MLYVTQVAPYVDGPAGVHGVLVQSTTAMAQLADAAGLAFRAVSDVRSLLAEEVAGAAVVALFTIGETPWTEAQRSSLLDSVRGGRTHLLAIHSATDSCYGWNEYGGLVGARFNGHPWTQEFTLDVCDPSHPAVAHLGSNWAWRDEVYQFRDLRPDAQILLRVDEAQLDLDRPGVIRPPYGFPLAWCFHEGLGRVFSTSLGHFAEAWESPTFLRHLAGGLSWLRSGTTNS